MDNRDLQELQYKNSDKYNARVVINAKYGTNKTPWPIWLFEHYRFKDNARIVEFGCGNGMLWKANSFRISAGWSILLTDFSAGMIEAAQKSLGASPANISYAVFDLSNGNMENEQYDNIVANHMLYHLANLDEALGKLARLLGHDGELYCSTVGENNMAEMKMLVKEFTGNDNYAQALGSITDRFSLENGTRQLKSHFKIVKRIDFEDALEITDPDDIASYVISCNDLERGLQVLLPEERDEFRGFVEKRMETAGKIHVSKSAGTFVASLG